MFKNALLVLMTGFLLSTVGFAQEVTGELPKDGPFPMMKAVGSWAGPDGTTAQITITGDLVNNSIPVNVKLFEADGTIYAEGSTLHYMLSPQLRATAVNDKSQLISMVFEAATNADHPVNNANYHLVLTISYVYSKGKEQNRHVVYLHRE